MVRALLTIVITVVHLLPMPACAHLMLPQRGTLNFVDGSAYLVLSLPVSAFPYANENGKNLIAAESFAKFQLRMAADIEAQVHLLDAKGPLQLEGTFLNFTPPDNDPSGAASDIVVLGRFKLRNQEDATATTLRLRMTVFGKATHEQFVTVTLTRMNPQSQQKEREQLVLSADRPERTIFASVWSLVTDYFRFGLERIRTGISPVSYLVVAHTAAG